MSAATLARPEAAAPDPGRDRPALASGALVLAAASMAVVAASYVWSLVLAHHLSAASYSTVAAGNALLLIGGTVAGTGVPWALARAIAEAPPGSPARRDAVVFAVGASFLLGLVAAFFTAVAATSFSSGPAVVAMAVSILVIFEGAAFQGWFQGGCRWLELSGLRMVEVVVRLAAGVAALAAGARAGGVLAGFAAGAAVVCLAGAWAARDDLRGGWPALPRVLGDRHRWADVGGLGAVQGLVTLLAGLDALLAAALASSPSEAAGYQVMATMARAPLFVGTAVSIVAFPYLTGPHRRSVARRSAVAFAVAVVPAGAAVALLPDGILHRLVPEGFRTDRGALVALVVAGVGYGMVNLGTTVLQAAGAYRRSVRVQAVGLAVFVALTVPAWLLAGTTVAAWAAAAGALCSAALVAAVAHRVLEEGDGPPPVAVVGPAAVPVARPAAEPPFGPHWWAWSPPPMPTGAGAGVGVGAIVDRAAS